MSSSPSDDWPKNANALVVRARQESARTGELVKLILSGTRELDSWLIENRILPALRQRGANLIQFSLGSPEQASRSATLLPLPDGSALARNAAGRWSPLDSREARHEIQYIGFRHAPSKRWRDGFQANLLQPDDSTASLSPSEVAKVWAEVTGTRPLGFEEGLRDQIHALGFNVLDKAFHTQGQLGL